MHTMSHVKRQKTENISVPNVYNVVLWLFPFIPLITMYTYGIFYENMKTLKSVLLKKFLG